MLRIGLIDSGVGGFSILNAFLEHPTLRDTTFLYVADSGHLPYGLKSDAYIHERMVKITEFLLSHNIDALVIACNTATAVSAEKLRTQYPNLPIIAIEPAIKPAAMATKTGHIAVAATKSTLESTRLEHLIEQYAQNCIVHKVVGTNWVDLVESQNITPHSNITPLLESLEVFQQYPIDQLVLGCTHFPFLAPVLDALLPLNVALINPAQSIVQTCYHRLHITINDSETKSLDHSISQQGINPITSPAVFVTLFTTGDLESFKAQTALLNLDKTSATIFKLSI